MEHRRIVKGSMLDSEEARRRIERPLGRLRRRLARLPVDAVHLRILVREANGSFRYRPAGLPGLWREEWLAPV